VFGIVLGLLFWRNITATWYANLGAVEMAKIELAQFPTGKWNEGQYVTALAPAEALFNRSLALNSQQRTANNRLGLIAMMRRDFNRAIPYLERAHQIDPGHKGITKPLAYSYVWIGDYDQALPLLRLIPEASNEMDVYTWWWHDQGRDDLAVKAKQIAAMLTK
jgi:tetratricopeptide (TPR) repeat protein